eukprot:CAMPEP_0194034178 /NCGR_PEP_ID=MMETSP0009_2-20130614/6579_1 /TAXON_ID=210454 /ORGANISM="Grammatophora oceanica, Strain CCMP 410" /LENGTH=595 /DNA_ID=CAMNT_0038674973 /DNA_START=99 /DNA_END=1883 /DNA_ORIENTATION=+
MSCSDHSDGAPTATPPTPTSVATLHEPGTAGVREYAGSPTLSNFRPNNLQYEFIPTNFKEPKRKRSPAEFHASFTTTKILERLSGALMGRDYDPCSASTWIGFWALLGVTCANYMLSPMRDAVALAVGVDHMPKLTLASTLLAVVSSVPIGWLFEAPDPMRRKLWKRMGLTRGETQGTSLALFYRCFAFLLLNYAVGFRFMKHIQSTDISQWAGTTLLTKLGFVNYVAFFLVVHLMKLHSLSLVWGVTTEAMEYEDVASAKSGNLSHRSRLQRLAFIGFGGTLGGILGSVLASSLARVLSLSGLMIFAAFFLEVSAELSIELGRIMRKHWEEQQLFNSSNDLASLDSSMKRSTSLGSMKRVASGNSLHKVRSMSELAGAQSHIKSTTSSQTPKARDDQVDDNSFLQRLRRGITTILRSRLLMAIFTYNALYASTSVLLSFQRADLVARRDTEITTEANTAFLANINIASSIAVFVLQATGFGALLAHTCGFRGTLALMPLVRLAGVVALAWWHRVSSGKPPNLILFLLLDECTRVINLAVAKPVRESLWRGLSNEARYEAKPIVDTLANRWGGGSAAFLVSLMDKLLDVFGIGAW